MRVWHRVALTGQSSLQTGVGCMFTNKVFAKFESKADLVRDSC